MPTRIDSSPSSLRLDASNSSVQYNGRRVSDPETRSKLSALADLLNRPVYVISGDRTPEDQERLSAQGFSPAQNSQHLLGKAADISVEGMTPSDLAEAARRVGFTGIGIYRDGHVHVDTRPHPATWTVQTEHSDSHVTPRASRRGA